MKCMNTREAVGRVLCNDITRIVRGVAKEARFRKGHVITEEDVPVLLNLGKDTVYIWENDESMLHEDDAAGVLRGICRGRAGCGGYGVSPRGCRGASPRPSAWTSGLKRRLKSP